MKLFSFAGHALLAACLISPVLAAPAVPVAKTAPAPAETKIIEFARQRDLNVFIDSTRIDVAAPLDELDPAARGAMKDVLNVLGVYSQEHHLSSAQLDAKTFVFWAEPDQDQLAAAIGRGEGFGAERGLGSPREVFLALRQQLDPEGTRQDLAATKAAADRPFDARKAQEERDQRRGAAAPQLEAKLADLPADLQRQVVALVVQLTLRGSGNLAPYNEVWTRDEVWQRARVIFRPASRVTNSPATLLVQANAEDGRNRLLLSIAPSFGSARAYVTADKADAMAPAPDGALLREAQLRVLPVDATQTAFIADTRPFLAPGASLKALQNAVSSPFDFGAEPTLSTLVSADVTRRPVAELVQLVARNTGVKLSVSPEFEVASPLISVRARAMSLSQWMQAVAHLLGATWTKGVAETFYLTKSNISPLEMELRRMGNFGWFRSRDIVMSTQQRRQEAFDQLAERIFDATGDNLVRPEGVAFSALAPEFQQELRAMATNLMARPVLQEQANVRDLLRGQWTFKLTGGTEFGARASSSLWAQPSLALFIDGQFARNLVLPTLPRAPRVAQAPPAQP